MKNKKVDKTEDKNDKTKSEDSELPDCCSPKKKVDDELPDCCRKVDAPEGKKTVLQAIGYGLLAHAGCIAFIIATVAGATAAVTFLKPLMMNRYFFYILIAISFVFATISAVLYLRKHKHLSWGGIKKKKKYLATMYGITIGVNLLLFLVIFPMLANTGGITGGAVGLASAPAVITLEVDIPCPGHAPLITNELKTLGVDVVRYSFPDTFKVGYDPGKVSKADIMGIDVFVPYPATVIDESTNTGVTTAGVVAGTSPARSSGGGCGCGGGTCGAPAGSAGGGSCCGS